MKMDNENEFVLRGVKYKAVEQSSDLICKNCAFYEDYDGCIDRQVGCSSKYRSDKRNVIFVKDEG